MGDADLVTTIVVAAITSGATRVVSAPLDGVADHVKERVKARLDRTLATAQAKAGDRPLDYSDRIAAKALSEAAWNDDELVSDYLGGILAASGHDDDGAAVIAQIGRLSAFQLRAHYVIYRELRRLAPLPAPNLYQSREASDAAVRVPLVDLAMAMQSSTLAQLPGTIEVLAREGLVGDQWTIAYESAVPPSHPLALTLQVSPTGIGAELFLWGHGIRPANANRLFEPELPVVMVSEVAATPCSTLVSNPPEGAAGPNDSHAHREGVSVDTSSGRPGALLLG